MNDALRTDRRSAASSERSPSTLVWVIASIIIALGVAYAVTRWAMHIPDIGLWGTEDAYAGRDFRSFAVSGRLARIGDVAHLYDSGSAPYAAANAASFVYPPWFAVAMIPLASIDFQVGYWAWMVGTLALAGWAMWAVAGRVGITVLGVLLAATPGLATFVFGQPAFLLVALASTMLLAIRRDDYVTAGVSGALMAFKPHIMVGLAVAWLNERRRYRWSIMTAIAATAALFVVGEVLLAGSTLAWPDAVGSVSPEYSQSIAELTVASVVDRAAGLDSTPMVTRVLVLGVGLAAFASLLSRRRLDTATVLFGAFGTTIVAGFHALTYDVLLLAPFISVIYVVRPGQRQLIGLYGAVALSTITIGPLLTQAQIATLGRAVPMGPLALAAFVVWIVVSTPDRPIGAS